MKRIIDTDDLLLPKIDYHYPAKSFLKEAERF